MDLKTLYDAIPPWDWPENAGEIFKEILDNPSADLSDRLLAAEMAGDLAVFNDELARTLLSIVGKSDENANLRARAATSFAPAFEHVHLYEFDDQDAIVLSKKLFGKIQASLKRFHYDADVPEEVRRRILEASVRAPQDWHFAVVRAAFASNDKNWRLTAVFCMRFIQGFDRQILKALESEIPDIRYQAISAAGNWGLKEAWPAIARLFSNPGTEKMMLLAAIDAAGGIGTPEAVNSLARFLVSDDDNIVEAAEEALVMLTSDEYDDGDEEAE